MRNLLLGVDMLRQQLRGKLTPGAEDILKQMERELDALASEVKAGDAKGATSPQAIQAPSP